MGLHLHGLSRFVQVLVNEEGVRVVRRYRAGISLEQIAMEERISASLLYRLIKMTGDFEPRRRGRRFGSQSYKFTGDTERRIIEAYQRGDKITDIASNHGCRRQTIQHLLKRNNIPRRGKKREQNPVPL